MKRIAFGFWPPSPRSLSAGRSPRTPRTRRRPRRRREAHAPVRRGTGHRLPHARTTSSRRAWASTSRSASRHFDLDAAARRHRRERVPRSALQALHVRLRVRPAADLALPGGLREHRRQPAPRRRLAELEVRGRRLAPVRAVQDAVLARGALQRRRPPVPGALARDRRLQAQPRHRRDGRRLLLEETTSRIRPASSEATARTPCAPRTT